MSNLADLRSPDPIPIHVAGVDLLISPLMMDRAADLQAIVNATPPKDHKETVKLLSEMLADGLIDKEGFDFQRR